MNMFDDMLKDVVEKHESEENTKPKTNHLGSRIGEQREIVIRYAVGRENEARVTLGTHGKNGKIEDSLAMMYALGNIVGEEHDMDGTAIGNEVVKTVSKCMLKGLLEAIF